MKSRIEYLNVDALQVDLEVQRGLKQARVEELAKNWDADGVGVITVSRRELKPGVTGDFIVDGQHRWAAAKRVGQAKIRAEVYTDLSRSDEAALFRVRNNTKVVSTYDKFRVRLVEGDKVALDLERMLNDNGWFVRVNRFQGHGSFTAIGALEWVYHGAERAEADTPFAAQQTMEILTAAWGTGELDAVRSDIVKGLGVFLVRYAGNLDLHKVINELQKYSGGPLKLSGDAKLLRSYRSMPVPDAVAMVLTGLYNKKRSVNRLPEWSQGK